MGVLKVVDRYARDNPELIRELEEKALPILDMDESSVQIATPAPAYPHTHKKGKWAVSLSSSRIEEDKGYREST